MDFQSSERQKRENERGVLPGEKGEKILGAVRYNRFFWSFIPSANY